MSSKVKALFVERISHRFKRMTTNSNQASGLTVCIKQIVDELSECVALKQIEANDSLVSVVSQYKPEKLIIEALCLNEPDMQLLRKNFPNMKIYVHIHSNLDFLAEEGAVWLWFELYHKYGVEIISNSLSLVLSWPFPGKIRYLPNIYKIAEPTDNNLVEKVCALDNPVLKIGCHGSIRPMKNQLVQVIAAINLAEQLGKKLELRMNLGREETKGKAVRSSIVSLFTQFPQHTLVSDPWVNHKDFVRSCSKLDIGLQVSLSETFNLVAADYTAAGIPIVVSNQIHWAHDSCKVDTSNPYLIAEAMHEILLKSQSVNAMNRTRLYNYYLEARGAWRDFIHS